MIQKTKALRRTAYYPLYENDTALGFNIVFFRLSFEQI